MTPCGRCKWFGDDPDDLSTEGGCCGPPTPAPGAGRTPAGFACPTFEPMEDSGDLAAPDRNS